MNVYVMKQLWFKTGLGVLAVLILGAAILSSPNRAQAYQGVSTPSGVIITVGNPPDGTNVRSGPNSVHYGPPIGHLNTGDTARALGKSPGGAWIEIEFPGSANGRGWVYAVNVVVSGGELPIVEPPPTATPAITATYDLTLAAAFDIQPTQTRLPTFTPPPPLSVPTFVDEPHIGSSSVFGIFIISLGLIGGIGLLVSYVLRK
jgi:hypothetical protein